MADNKRNEILDDYDFENGLPPVKKRFWQTTPWLVFFGGLLFLLGLAAVVAGVFLFAFLVPTMAWTMPAIVIGAAIGLVAFIVGTILVLAVYKLVSVLLADKPQVFNASEVEPILQADSMGHDHEAEQDPDFRPGPSASSLPISVEDSEESGMDEAPEPDSDFAALSESSSPSSAGERVLPSFSLLKGLKPSLQRSNAMSFLPRPVTKEDRQQLKDSFTVFATDACSEQIISTLSGENVHKFTRYSSADLTEIQPANSSRELLEQIEARMQVLEQLKHPEPYWSYSRLDPQRPGEKVIIKIEHFEIPEEPNSAIIAEKKRYSLATRKLTVLGGVLSLLDSPAFLTSDREKKEEIRGYLARLSNQVLTDAHRGSGLSDVNKSMNGFVVKLNKELAAIVGIKKEADIRANITGPVREAERYFVAEHNQNKVLVVITQRRDGSKIMQVDNSFNHELTETQRTEYMKIHGANQPLWFRQLHLAEQDWYLARIPRTMDAPEWADFEKLFKSSAMQHTPGLANARVNYLISQTSGGAFKVESSSMKTGTPVTYEMQRNDCEQQTLLNTMQEVEKLKKIADHHFDTLWGSFFEEHEVEKPPRLLLIQSLLSSKSKLTKADEGLIVAQRRAVEQAQFSIDPSSYTLIHHNNATNTFRHMEKKDADRQAEAELTDLRVQGKRFITRVLTLSSQQSFAREGEVLHAFINGEKVLCAAQLNRLTQLIDSVSLTEPQKSSLRVLVNVENQFRNLGSVMALGSDRRNQEEYIIALKKMFVEAMGGAAKNNCKSGKDRTGQSEIYQHALCLETRKNKDRVPAYAEKGEKRKDFCDTAALLNCSMKIQEAAAFNTPGSAGTKAPKVADIIDSQIVDKMKTLHSVGCTLAGLNKCQAHVKDEERKMEAIRARDQRPQPEGDEMEIAFSS